MLQSERIFYNEKLKKVSELAKNNGLKVYTFESSSKFIKQIFFTDGVNIGTSSENFSSIYFGTIHKPCRECGTGFGFEETSTPTIEDIKQSFVKNPRWATINQIKAVKKYINWNEFTEKSNLKYFEL